MASADSIGMSLLTGFCVGFFMAVIFLAKVATEIDKLRVKKGFFSHDGDAYRLKKIERDA